MTKDSNHEDNNKELECVEPFMQAHGDKREEEADEEDGKSWFEAPLFMPIFFFLRFYLPVQDLVSDCFQVYFLWSINPIFGKISLGLFFGPSVLGFVMVMVNFKDKILTTQQMIQACKYF